VSDGNDDLASDVKLALQKKIVRLVDGAREAVLDRSQRIVRSAFCDGSEKRFETPARYEPDLLA
jgi:hypothetical protein